MRACRTVSMNVVHVLEGGTKENDLWTYITADQLENPVMCSVWVPTDAEREQIANGSNIRLSIWGTRTPPVMMDLTDEELVESTDEINDN